MSGTLRLPNGPTCPERTSLADSGRTRLLASLGSRCVAEPDTGHRAADSREPSVNAAPWRAVVCDSRPVVRAGLAAVVAPLGPVCEAALDEVPAVVTAGRTDVLVAGLRIDDVDTFPVIAARTSADPALRVLVVADGATVIDMREAVIAGVDSFVLASAPVGEVRDAAAATARGDRIISPSIAMQLAGSWRTEPHATGAASLTTRELEVLQLLAEGLTNDRIGDRVGLSSRTVKTHVQNLLLKLDAADRTGAVARGFRLGLIR
jgi:DNA-binding NarL/FixJ family response regulator